MHKVGGNPISLPALYNIFSNIRYAGIIVDPHTGEHFTANFPPMISHDEYDRVQELLGRKGMPRLTARSKLFALRGFIRCRQCGFMVTAEEKRKKMRDGSIKSFRYYHCTHKSKVMECKQGSVEEKELYRQLRELLDSYDLIPELHEIGLRALDELAKHEVGSRNSTQNMQNDSIKSTEEQLDRLLNLATRGLITADKYEAESRELEKRLKNLQSAQKKTNERVLGWYKTMGNTLSSLENANEDFINGVLADKRRILSALGSNPILTDGKLSIAEHFWLQPLKENKAKITDKVMAARTAPEQIRKGLNEAIFTQWYTRQDSNLRPLGSKPSTLIR